MEYYEAITVIDAQDRMVELSIADYGTAKQESRKKLHKQIFKLANPTHLRPEMDFEEFQRKMNGN